MIFIFYVDDLYFFVRWLLFFVRWFAFYKHSTLDFVLLEPSCGCGHLRLWLARGKEDFFFFDFLSGAFMWSLLQLPQFTGIVSSKRNTKSISSAISSQHNCHEKFLHKICHSELTLNCRLRHLCVKLIHTT